MQFPAFPGEDPGSPFLGGVFRTPQTPPPPVIRPPYGSIFPQSQVLVTPMGYKYIHRHRLPLFN